MKKKPRKTTISDEVTEIAQEERDTLERLDLDFSEIDKRLDIDMKELDGLELPDIEGQLDFEKDFDLSFQGLDLDDKDIEYPDIDEILKDNDFMNLDYPFPPIPEVEEWSQRRLQERGNVQPGARKTPQTKKTTHTRTHKAGVNVNKTDTPAPKAAATRTKRQKNK